MVPKKTPKRASQIEAMKEFQQEFRKQLVTLISAAFAFVAALFWNTAITDAIKTFIPVSSGAWFYEIISAIIVTIVAVTAVYFISKLK